MFSVYTRPEKSENATIFGHFGFEFEETSVRKITWLLWRRRRKAPSSKCFPSTQKSKAGVIKFLWFEARFRKAPFSWRINVDGRPNRRNKAAFSNFSGVLWRQHKNVLHPPVLEDSKSLGEFKNLVYENPHPTSDQDVPDYFQILPNSLKSYRHQAMLSRKGLLAISYIR